MLLGIIGPAGAGKTTVARILVEDYGFKRLPFAGPLKRMLGPSGLGLSLAEVDGDRKEKSSPLLSGHTPRYAMQRLGTEWGRNCMHPDFWVNCWIEDSMKVPNNDVSIVADDVRFGNEIHAIKSGGGQIIRMVGRSAGIGDEHASEKIPDYPEALIVDNSGDMDFLRAGIHRLVGGNYVAISNLDLPPITRHAAGVITFGTVK